MIQPEIKIDKKKKEAQREKIVTVFIYLVITLAVIILFFTVKSTFFPGKSNDQVTTWAATMQVPTTSRMSLTSYDKELARKFMDKDNDGKCDVCGMDVNICIESGQVQCNMDSKSNIGIVGSEHTHADWKIFINGKALDGEFFKPFAEAHEAAMKDTSIKTTSSLMHVHEAPENPSEKVGDVLHMHATGVPLWMFFESLGMKFSKDCLVLENGEKYCNDDKNKLKFYVNGEPNKELENYVFKDLDKILISYGDRNEDISYQSNLVTDYSKNH